MSKTLNKESLLQMMNEISPSFCAAKWTQVTIDLVNGTNHSCHHPKRHEIDIDSLADNPSAMHNTAFKKEQRQLMLDGQRPAECVYCWDMEDLGQTYSDRFIKTTDDWSLSEIEKITSQKATVDFSPTYVEIMIDKLCNFSCAYCTADVSTGVESEIKKFGAYNIKNSSWRMTEGLYSDEKYEKLKTAYHQWLPQLLPTLQIFRLTGGEPLLSPLFWNTLNEVEKHGHVKLDLAVNTHLSHQPGMIDRLVERARSLKQAEKIKDLVVYTSVDTWGEDAEFIRNGLDLDKWETNVLRLLAENIPVVIMSTFNILSIPRFHQLIDWVAHLKAKNLNITLDISYLKNPICLRADIATPDLQIQLQRTIDHAHSLKVFSAHESEKFDNLLTWVLSKNSPAYLVETRADFYKFVNDYSRRKNKDFLAIFPTLKPLYMESKKSLFIKPELMK